MKFSHHFKIAAFWLGLILLSGVLAFIYRDYFIKNFNVPEPIACTMEAKQCPDGSYVGRSGPNCEFAKCPDVKSSVKEFKNEKFGYSVNYPAEYFAKPGDVDCFSATEGDSDAPGFCILFKVNVKNQDLHTWRNENISKYGDWEEKIVSVAGEEALMLETPALDGFPETIAIFSHGKFIVEIWGTDVMGALNSFKFIEIGTVFGKVSIGPLCPVEPCNSTADPYSGKKLVFMSGEAGKTFYANLKSNGSYLLELPESNYSVTLSDCQYMGCSRVFPKNIGVVANKNLELNIDIDTGIR